MTRRRRSTRLHNYDYARPGAYFVTICTQKRLSLLGHIHLGEMILSPTGKIIKECWFRLQNHFTFVVLDSFVTMPNHIHGILHIEGRGEASGVKMSTANLAHIPDASPLGAPRGTVKGSLGAIIQNFKSVSTRKVNQIHGTLGEIIWQRNYYDHIIRTEHALLTIRQYIQDNPARWEFDRYNPDRIESDAHEQNLGGIIHLIGASQ
jgi:putative transposase